MTATVLFENSNQSLIFDKNSQLQIYFNFFLKHFSLISVLKVHILVHLKTPFCSQGI